MARDLNPEIEELVSDFLRVADLAHDPISRSEIDVVYLPAPHVPSALPMGKMAIYGFWHDGEWLKIGKAGPKTRARYLHQHYNAGSAPSTLAETLLNDPEMASMIGFESRDVGDWIKSATCRVNILLPSSRDSRLLSLLEAFLHVRLRPRYEGRLLTS